MSLSIVFACLWLIAANVIGMFPSRHHHWPAAYALIAVGLPLLGFVVMENGFWVGFIVLAGAASILRWPVRYLLRWVRSLLPLRAAD